jgi:hypothetical protein
MHKYYTASEQQLFEKLSMPDNELNLPDYNRDDMKHVATYEQILPKKHRAIRASWSYTDYISAPLVDISTLTTDEQADLIVKKLKTAPEYRNQDQTVCFTSASLAKQISDAIDIEVLENIKKI